jgi:hypothetical protein
MEFDLLVRDLRNTVLISVAVGFVLGWALRQIVYGNRLKEVNSMWRGRLNRAEDEREELRERVTSLDNDLLSNEAAWSKKHTTLAKERDTLSDRVDELAIRERDLETSWQQRVSEVETERNELNARIQELTAEVGRASSLERERDTFRAKVKELTTHLTTAESAWRERAEKAEEDRDRFAADAQRASANSAPGATAVRIAELQRERDLFSAQVSELNTRLTTLRNRYGDTGESATSIDNGSSETSVSDAPSAATIRDAFAASTGEPGVRQSYRVEDIEGVGEVYGRRLRAANIATTGELVRRCCDASGRRDVARETGFGESLLLKWANIADLMRVPGVGTESAALLEAAGVDTVNELRHRSPENLAAKMAEVNLVRRLARKAPEARTVAEWIEESRRVPPAISI